MTSVTLLRQAQNDAVTLARREVRSVWRTLDYTDPVAAVLAIEDLFAAIVQAYGELAGAAAADFYEELREQSPAARGNYTALLASPPPLEQIRKTTKWAATPLFVASDPAKTLARFEGVTDRLVKKQARETITLNVERDPARARFARVPTGKNTCAFCLMLAGRGAVYSSGREAGWQMGKYHDDCDCVPTPVWDASDLARVKDETGYDPKAFENIFKDGRDAAKSDSLKGSDGILAAIRLQQGVR